MNFTGSKFLVSAGLMKIDGTDELKTTPLMDRWLNSPPRCDRTIPAFIISTSVNNEFFSFFIRLGRRQETQTRCFLPWDQLLLLETLAFPRRGDLY